MKLYLILTDLDPVDDAIREAINGHARWASYDLSPNEYLNMMPKEVAERLAEPMASALGFGHHAAMRAVKQP